MRTSTKDERILEHLRVAEEELARVTQIVTHSLRFHRASTAPTWERISETLESAAAIYKSRISSNKIEIRRRYRDKAAVRCYSSELRQVFGNLIGNAFDAIRKGGFIYLRARDATYPSSHQPGVRVTVADTGHGMDRQTVQRLAEPFFTTKGNNGTGLGLWISYDILQKHQAILRVRSRSMGERTGTVFSIFFPFNGV